MVTMDQELKSATCADFDQRFNCNCGKAGCIETVASATGVVNLVNFYYPKLTFKSSILQLIKDNKVTAKAVLMLLKLVINSVFLSQKKLQIILVIYVAL